MTDPAFPIYENNKLYVGYDPATGRIDHVRQTSDINKYAGSGFAYVEAPFSDVQSDTNGFYVSNGEVVECLQFDVPSELTLVVGNEQSLAVPAGTIASFDGTDYAIADGELIVTGDFVGTYDIRLALWPYVPKTIKVTVNAA